MKSFVLLRQVTDNSEQTEQLASDFAKKLSNHDFIALYGDLGAGKTSFTRGIISALMPGTDFCGSPTYTIVNEYENEKIKISHFDMYRITDDDDLYSIGFYDYVDSIIITEWSENIVSSLPDNRYEVHIEKLEGDKRNIIIQKVVAENENIGF